MSWIGKIDLPKLITQRRLEKRLVAKEKLHHDLKVISNGRVCKDELEPFPGGSFGRFNQENIWEDILRHINNPSDVTSSFFTCKHFAEILEERRKLILLPNTLSILEENEVLRKRDLLVLRRTSKSWKQIAEHEIYEASLVGESWFLYMNQLLINYYDVFDNRVLRNTKTVNDALNALSKVEGKETPLVRKLCVDRSQRSTGRDEPMFQDKVLEFLEIYGESVWIFMYGGNREIQDYVHLWHMLRKMPNLKAVAFQLFSKPTKECSSDEIILIEDMLERMPFPILDSLEYVQLTSDDNENFLEHIYRRCTNDVKCIYHIGYSIFNEAVSSEVKKFSLKRLVCPADTMILSPNSANWPLKVLAINDFYNSINASVLWPALNRFKGTLEHLRMDLRILKDQDMGLLQLSKLKYLDLGIISAGTIGFDDLLPLKSLENLIVRKYEEKDQLQDKNALIKVFGIVEKMEKSNIWAFFPNLQILEFQFQNWGYIKEGSTLTVCRILNICQRWLEERIYENFDACKE